MPRFESDNRRNSALTAPRKRRTSQARITPPIGDSAVSDRVPWGCPGAVEIGFSIPTRYNASEVLFHNLREGRGNRWAVIGPAGQRTYAQLAADASRWGHALLSVGLQPGDRLLLLLDDSPVYPAVFFGAIRAGLVPVLLNILTPPAQLAFCLLDSAAKAAVAEAALCDRLVAADLSSTPLKTLIVVNGRADPVVPDVDVKQARHWLPAFSDHLTAMDTHRDDMAFWMYSSGSTGNPKGIVHLQHDMPYTDLSYARSVLKLTPDDICFSVPKIFFSYGFGNSITFPFSAGATSLLMPGRPTPTAVFSAVAQYRPTLFFGLPTLYTMLTGAPDIGSADFSAVRLAVSAAEILSDEVAGAWRVATGLDIVECLGSTEMLNVYLSNTPQRRKSGSAGQRVPGYEIVLKDNDGRELADGREGVMWIRGHSSTPLFWNQPDRTERTIRGDGWLCTGDRFIRDHEGFYFFRGRTDDLIKISGQWVHPAEVQRCLAEHPSIRECAVLAIELPDRRMTLKAYVVMKHRDFDPKSTTRSLQSYVKQALMPYKYPRIVEFMPELPKTGTGKIDRQALLAGADAVEKRGAAA